MAVPGLCCCGFPLVVASEGLPWVAERGFLVAVASLVENLGPRGSGFGSYSTWAQWLWGIVFVALRHVESSWTRDQTHVPCFGRRILNLPKRCFFSCLFFAATQGSIAWMCSNLFNEDMFSAGPEKAAIFKEDTGKGVLFPGQEGSYLKRADRAEAH